MKSTFYTNSLSIEDNALGEHDLKLPKNITSRSNVSLNLQLIFINCRN